MTIREYLESDLWRLQVGESLRIEATMFHEAYPWGWPTIYHDAKESFLSKMMGSAWGEWRVEYDRENHWYIVSRHKPDTKRHYVDPDRRHMYKRMPDGTLEIKERYTW